MIWMVSCNVRINDVLKGSLTSIFIYIQYGHPIYYATLQKMYLQMMGNTINVTAQLHLRNIFVVSPLHYLTFSKHTCICRSAEYVYANVNEGEHCRWHFAACTLCHANPEVFHFNKYVEIVKLMKSRNSVGKMYGSGSSANRHANLQP
ncbi:hypothetical protein T09_138 [Trichinella sp. T9]|nr:hypothetical protein T09_138 [Trichinella sp. T9]